MNSSRSARSSLRTANPLLGHSCARCRHRKVKCDKKNPCTNCVSHKTACLPASPVSPRPRKKRFPEAELLARLRKYEAALAELGVDPESVLTQDIGVRLETGESREPNIRDGGQTLSSEHTEAVGPEVNDDQTVRVPILTVRDDALESPTPSLLFSGAGLAIDLPKQHPPLPIIFTLWQVFVDSVHPLLQVFHLPSLQPQILSAISDLPNASTSMHILLLSIYTLAVTAMSEDACLASLRETKRQAVARFQDATQRALQTAEFMQSNELSVLQAFVLYLHAAVDSTHPRSFLCLAGIAERIARRLGLHRSNLPRNMTPFEAEMRKRVWWQIALLDTRAAELSGAGASIFDSAWTMELPLNINESDINPQAKELPRPCPWATDAIFVQMRCRVENFNLHDLPLITSRSNIAMSEKFKVIEIFNTQLQEEFFKYCDDNVPLQLLTKSYAKFSIAKMKIRTYSTERHTRPGSEAPDQAQVNLMHTCVQAIESYSQCSQVNALERFAWFSWVTFPFLAYVHLLSSLRTWPSSESADEGWKTLSVSPKGAFSQHKWLSGEVEESSTHVGVQRAFARLVVEAWEAREATRPGFESPELVTNMRRKLKDGDVSGKLGDDPPPTLPIQISSPIIEPSIGGRRESGIQSAQPVEHNEASLVGRMSNVPEMDPSGVHSITSLLDEDWETLFSVDAFKDNMDWFMS